MSRRLDGRTEEVHNLNRSLTSPLRARWWRRQRRKWTQWIRAEMPRFDWRGL